MTKYVIPVILLVVLSVACTTGSTGPAATPEPTPTMTDDELIGEMILTPAAHQQNRPTSIFDPTFVPVVEVKGEPPVPVAMPLPQEVTQGVQALVHCAGQSETYWLESGPPPMDAELVSCLNDYLEAN